MDIKAIDNLAAAFLRYQGQRGTFKQIAELIRNLGGYEYAAASLARMCAERNIVIKGSN